MAVLDIMPETGSETKAMQFCRVNCKRSVLHFRYAPKPPTRNYKDSKFNICHIETNAGTKNFLQVREVFYDYLVDVYSNKPNLIRNDSGNNNIQNR